jgi:hypothetical protein
MSQTPLTLSPAVAPVIRPPADGHLGEPPTTEPSKPCPKRSLNEGAHKQRDRD